MRKEGMILGGIGLLSVVLVVAAAFFLSKPQSATPQTSKVTDMNLLMGAKESREEIGSESAKATIVEFGDYQCPACKSAHPVIKQILEEYKDKVYFVFRNFPLPMHQNAQLGANAALAAGEQGKFWEMHDKLYEEQEEWGESVRAKEIILGYADDLGLDKTKFEADIEAQVGKAVISKDQDDGYQLGVNSTPTFFINGTMFPGVVDYEQLKAELDKVVK